MEAVTLTVEKPSEQTAKEIRSSGKIPIIYYGKNVDKNEQFSVDYQDFRRAYEKGGKSTIFTFVTEDKKEYPVLVHEIQYHPVSDDIIHVDVMAVEAGKKITTDIAIVFTGMAPAVKELGGILMHNKESVHIECLPKDLVHDIEVDISSLVDFSLSINVGDLNVPEAITVLDAPEIVIATVSAPRVIEEEEVTAEEGEEGEGEEGEGEEGEAAETAEKGAAKEGEKSESSKEASE